MNKRQRMEKQVDISNLFEEANSFYYGLTKNKDIQKAIEVFENIMEIGKSGWGDSVYPDIFNNYVYYKYDDGAKENKDYELAAKLYKIAVRNGSLNAMNNLGFLNLNGLGVQKNIDVAEELWKNGSEKGDDKCQMNLAMLYTSDQFGLQDYSKSVRYCDLAAKNGNQGAKELLPVLQIANRRLNKTEKNNVNFMTKLKNLFK
jgi:TPR repeat protein